MAIYLELSYSTFSFFFKRLNKNKDQSLFEILAKLKESKYRDLFAKGR